MCNLWHTCDTPMPRQGLLSANMHACRQRDTLETLASGPVQQVQPEGDPANMDAGICATRGPGA